MRKYPVLPILSRVASKAYQVPGSNITIEKGTEIVISLNGLHHDQTYFPNPEIFDPDRFSEEEIRKRHKFAYLPFGGGPRNCIGIVLLFIYFLFNELCNFTMCHKLRFTTKKNNTGA